MGLLDIFTFKKNADHLNKRGLKLLKTGNNRGALKYFNKALKINPYSDEIIYNRAITYWELGYYYEALIDLDSVLDVNPLHSDAWFNLGVIVSEFGRYHDALEFINFALELDPKHAETLHNKGIIHKNKKI